jgi:hypothetical protein
MRNKHFLTKIQTESFFHPNGPNTLYGSLRGPQHSANSSNLASFQNRITTLEEVIQRVPELIGHYSILEVIRLFRQRCGTGTGTVGTVTF